MVDIAVWREAAVIHIANPEFGVQKAACKIGTSGMIFNNRPAYFPALIKELRIYQWAKNLLLFVPLMVLWIYTYYGMVFWRL